MINLFAIIGTVTEKGPEKFTTQGKAVQDFTIKNRDGVFKCSAFDYPVKYLQNIYVGDVISVEGKLRSRAYDKNGKHYDFLELSARSIQLMTSGIGGGNELPQADEGDGIGL